MRVRGGEHKTRPLETAGGMDISVVQSLHVGSSESANDKLCQLLFFVGALKDAGAGASPPSCLSVIALVVHGLFGPCWRTRTASSSSTGALPTSLPFIQDHTEDDYTIRVGIEEGVSADKVAGKHANP
jgi:hypothetical protein